MTDHCRNFDYQGDNDGPCDSYCHGTWREPKDENTHCCLSEGCLTEREEKHVATVKKLKDEIADLKVKYGEPETSRRIAVLNRIIGGMNVVIEGKEEKLADLKSKIRSLSTDISVDKSTVNTLTETVRHFSETRPKHCPKMDRANRETCDDCERKTDPPDHCCIERACSVEELFSREELTK